MRSLRASVRRARSNLPQKESFLRTEDNLPVCNISVDKLSKKIKKSLIVKHFAKFGSIKNVKIINGKTRSRAKKCIVSFKEPNAATAALKQSLHTLNYEAVTVKPCPSWEQPFIDNNSPTTTTTTTSNEVSIFALNEYCLEIIFRNLDLRQQVRFSLCHQRFENVFYRMISPRVIKSFSFEQIRGFTLWEIRQLFKTAGQFMESFEITRIDCPLTMKYEIAIYDFMREYCVNVERLQIIRRRFVFTNFLNVLNVNNISELELYDCDLYEGETAHLRILRNLEILGLGRNKHITGNKLTHLKKLHTLSLYGCKKINQNTLIVICQSLKLRYLDIRGIDGIRNWSSMLQHCTLLESLKISRVDCEVREGTDSIARLPRLKKLEMQFFERAMPSSFYDTLVDHHAEDLEELKITGNIYALFPTVMTNIAKFKGIRVLWLGDNEYNSSKNFLRLISTLKELQEINLNYSIRIKGDHILPLLAECPKLSRLSLRYCKHITNDFIFKAIAILEKRTNMETPLILLVAGTRIQRTILQDTKYLNAKHLLRISFHIDIAELGYIEEKNEFTLAGKCDEDSPEGDVAVHQNNDYDDLSSYWFSDESSDEELEIFFLL